MSPLFAHTLRDAESSTTQRLSKVADAVRAVCSAPLTRSDRAALLVAARAVRRAGRAK